MGCGCGGRKSGTRATPASSAVPNAVSGRQVQVQSNQRQVMAQQARERIQQNATSAQRNALGARAEIEKRRRIQVSLKNRARGS